MSDLSKALVELRKSADLSRRQLEEVSGVSEETIKKIEYGRNVRPTPDTLKKIAAGLAKNRALGRTDHAAAAEMLATLMQAADYVPPPEPVAPAEPVELDVVAQVRDLLTAEPDALKAILADLTDGQSSDDQARQLRFIRDMLKSSRLLIPNGG